MKTKKHDYCGDQKLNAKKLASTFKLLNLRKLKQERVFVNKEIKVSLDLEESLTK